MNTLDIILKRRSIRKFKDDEISDLIIEKLLISAMAAPSACNKRPWEFYIIKNSQLLNELKMSSRFSNMNSKLIIIVAGNTKNSLTLESNDFWIQDCSSATTNILNVATELGLGSCWCGLYPIKAAVNRVRKILNLEDNIIPMALIHLGYPMEEKEARTQYEEEKVHFYE